MLSLKDIANEFGGSLEGDSSIQLERVSSLKHASAGSIAFFLDTKYQDALDHTLASAVILKKEHSPLTSKPKIITDNPYAYFAKVSALMNPKKVMIAGVNQSSSISTTATLSSSASIAENVVIGDGVTIGHGVSIGPNVVIERNVVIGENTVIESGVSVKYGTTIGDHCHLFSGCTIGGDGFGYAEENKQWVKIPQVGNVIIGSHVDVGANTTIDRGALDDTIIGDGVKLDNLIQIGHNCIIGEHTVIAGCTGIAGSAVIGKYCKIGGAAMILGHLKIADNVTISPGSMITRSIRKAGTYTALMPFQAHGDWLKTAASIRKIDQLTSKISDLEKTVKRLTKK